MIKICRPPTESTFSINSLMYAGILVGNCPLNVAKVCKMLRGQFLGQDRGSKVIWRSNFQIHNLSILIADLDSLQKSMNVKWAPFFDIPSRTRSNSRSKSQNQGKFKQMNNFADFATLTKNLIVFCLEYQKKERTLLLYFFARNPNLQSKLKNSDF